MILRTLKMMKSATRRTKRTDNVLHLQCRMAKQPQKLRQIKATSCFLRKIRNIMDLIVQIRFRKTQMVLTKERHWLSQTYSRGRATVRNIDNRWAERSSRMKMRMDGFCIMLTILKNNMNRIKMWGKVKRIRENRCLIKCNQLHILHQSNWGLAKWKVRGNKIWISMLEMIQQFVSAICRALTAK